MFFMIRYKVIRRDGDIMTDSITFIHAADLHLDSPFKGLKKLPTTIFNDVKQSTFSALDQLVHHAILKKVDFILLVGDLFDNEKQSLKAQIHLRTAFERLQEHNIDVYLSYGNHDYIVGNPYRVRFPENVHIFQEETVTHFTYKKNTNALAQIYGFSYHNRAVQMNKTSEYEIQNKEIPYHIATLHGSVHGNTTHDPYAPFSLTDLQTKPFDYWALGHIHERAELATTPPIIYPGNTQGRHRNEQGEKGCYIVEMTPTNTLYNFIPLQSMQFIEHHLDVTHSKTIHDLEQFILSNMVKTNEKQLIHLTLASTSTELQTFQSEGLIDELVEWINEGQSHQDNWQYIYAYNIDVKREKEVVLEDEFISEIEYAIETMDTKTALTELFHHPVARKYVTPKADDTLRQAAKKLLFEELAQTKERDS